MTMQQYVQATNQKLSLLNTRTRITDWYHATGNFVVQASDNNRMSVADELSLALGTPCATVPIDDLVAYAALARKAPSPTTEPGFRWTRGIAFWANGKPCTINLNPTCHAVFFPIDKHTVGAFRRDQLAEGKEALDRENRAGGWGAISADITKAIGGTWTSRALDRIEGTVAKALNYSPHVLNQENVRHVALDRRRVSGTMNNKETSESYFRGDVRGRALPRNL
jgi:hypothetical protein